MTIESPVDVSRHEKLWPRPPFRVKNWRMRGFAIPKHYGCSDVLGQIEPLGWASYCSQPLTLSSSSCFKSWEASTKLRLPTMLLDFQEYVCFSDKRDKQNWFQPFPCLFLPWTLQRCLEPQQPSSCSTRKRPGWLPSSWLSHTLTQQQQLPASRFLVWRKNVSHS